MPSPLLVSNLHNLLPYSSMSYTTILFLVLSIFSIFSIITFLCGTKNMKNLYKEEEATTASSSNKNKLISKLKRKINRRTLSRMKMKMLYWRKIEVEELEEGNKDDDEEEALWKKNILMGEKCRPIDEEN
ncbi:unnamed protein product [Lathyrus oleraceus]|uniref:uncharacterized protein LOC127121168 n=1 Tax=Pisum sativum TaxID=3888 RepID=UPI0021D357D1|nr:uncharacterized protein LOC127121168 [Pisum sativum]